MEYRGEGWERIRNYALGGQDLIRFKKNLTIDKSNRYVSIDWGAKRLMQRLLKRFRRRIKTRNFIWRLRLIAYKK